MALLSYVRLLLTKSSGLSSLPVLLLGIAPYCLALSRHCGCFEYLVRSGNHLAERHWLSSLCFLYWTSSSKQSDLWLVFCWLSIRLGYWSSSSLPLSVSFETGFSYGSYYRSFIAFFFHFISHLVIRFHFLTIRLSAHFSSALAVFWKSECDSNPGEAISRLLPFPSQSPSQVYSFLWKRALFHVGHPQYMPDCHRWAVWYLLVCSQLESRWPL